ncbi:MAG: 50S ribosomal protein L25 [Patescibacteria group bacterium]
MNLTVEKREKFGKAVKALRKGGFIPAELYGHGTGNLHLTLPELDFMRTLKEAGESSVISLMVNGAEHPVLIHDVERDFLSGKVCHVDFYAVRMDEKIKTHIPIEFTGEAPAVKEKGGFLNKALSEVEVEALPGDLPHNFVLLLDSLAELDQSLYVRDIAVPRGVKVLVAEDTVVATVMPPLKEEEKVEAPADITAVKVEGEEKKAERVAEKAKQGEAE